MSFCGVSQLLLQAADPAQTAAFLVLLRAKVIGALPCGEECRSQPKGSSASQGETPSEIAGLAQAMRNNAVKVEAGDEVLDIVGTGGDRCASPCHPPGKGAVQKTRRFARSAGTVNISTGACVVAAAAGAKVGPCEREHPA